MTSLALKYDISQSSWVCNGSLHIVAGYALRSRSALERGHEEQPSGWNCQCVVGRQPMQVSKRRVGIMNPGLTRMQHAL